MTNNDEKAAEEYADKHSEVVDSFGSMPDYEKLEKAFLAGVEHARPKWYRTEDKFPSIGDAIIAYYRITPASKRLLWCAGEVDGSDDGLFIDLEVDGIDMESVVYWMPLPKPPEGE